jgi:hypothetical protein
MSRCINEKYRKEVDPDKNSFCPTCFLKKVNETDIKIEYESECGYKAVRYKRFSNELEMPEV